MEEKTIQVAITPLLATCLQRLLVDEIDNQNKWKKEDSTRGIDENYLKLREEIINECNDLQEQLAKQGIHKHIKCY